MNFVIYKITEAAGCPWLVAVILAAWEDEIQSILVSDHSSQKKLYTTPSQPTARQVSIPTYMGSRDR
jgi:hypothetical protein